MTSVDIDTRDGIEEVAHILISFSPNAPLPYPSAKLHPTFHISRETKYSQRPHPPSFLRQTSKSSEALQEQPSSSDDDEFTANSDGEASDDSDRSRYRPAHYRARVHGGSSSKGVQKRHPANGRDFNPRQKGILQAWWNEHFHFPRPTRDELAQLSKDCGLHRNKVYKWFDNQRTRYLAKHGDAPFNGASKRGRPGKADQPLVVDVRDNVDFAASLSTVLEEVDLRLSCMCASLIYL